MKAEAVQHVLDSLAAGRLSDELFRSQHGPGPAFSHPAWRAARAGVLAGLTQGGVTALSGPAGSGKTMLLQEVARTLRAQGRPVTVLGHPAALGEAGVQAGAGAVVLIDEADGIGEEALQQLSGAAVALAGLPGFEARLGGANLVRLGLLDAQDVARYVAARLAAAGGSRDMVSAEAVLGLARHSGGVFRLVNALGGAAVVVARLAGARVLGAEHVAEAAALRRELAGEIAAETGEEVGVSAVNVAGCAVAGVAPATEAAAVRDESGAGAGRACAGGAGGPAGAGSGRRAVEAAGDGRVGIGGAGRGDGGLGVAPRDGWRGWWIGAGGGWGTLAGSGGACGGPYRA